MLKSGFQLIGLTAVLENDRKVNEWLGVELLQYQRRPVDLRIGYLWNGMFHYRAYNNQETGEERLLDKPPAESTDIITALVSKLADKGEQSLVFVKDKSTAHSLAEKMVGELSQPQGDEAINDLDELEPTASTDELRELLIKGLAIHRADLTPEERALVESHFRKGGIRVLVSTTTLAMGVNLPTRNVIIELEKWDSSPGDARPHTIPLPKSDFENMGGRAGRFQLEDEYGRAIAVLTRHIECDQFKHIYLDGNLEDVKPNLWRDSMATTVLGIVALGGCKTLKEVRTFLRNTLTWHLCSEAKSKAELDEQLEEGIATCLHVGVLTKTGLSLVEPTDLGSAISANGIRVETGGMIKE